MIRTRWLKSLAICALGLLPVSASAGESPLSHVPADTQVLISLQGLERTKQRLAAMMENADADLAKKALPHLEEALEKALGGRKLVGLSPNGPIFVAFTSLPLPGSGEPSGAFIARVTDYKAFREGFLTEDEAKNSKKEKAGYEVATVEGQEVYLMHRKGYAIVASSKELAEQFLNDKGTGLEGKLSKEVTRHLLENDVALYVDMTGINKTYGFFIQQGRQTLPTIIDAAAENVPGQLDKASLKVVKDYIDGLFQGVEDSKHLLLSVALPPEGLALHVEAGFVKSTTTSKLLAKMKPAALTKLETLPPGYMGYLAMEWGTEAFRAVEPLVLGVLGAPEGSNAKALKEALDQLVGAGPAGALGAMAPPGKTLQVIHYENPAKAAAAQLKLYEALADVMNFGNMPLKEKPVIRADAETFRGTKFHYFSVKWDIDKQLANLPVGGQQLSDAIKKLTGEGVNLWFGPLEGNVVAVQAKDWKNAEKILTQYVDKNATVGKKNKGFEQTRQRLPAKASAIALVSVPAAVDLGGVYMTAILEAMGMPAPHLAKAKTAEPFLGVSVTLHSGYAGLDLWIPGQTAREVRRVVDAFKGAGDGQ